ncbi:MAG: menaquinone biosynthesis decarboxylase [Acidobacteria bacterium]|nr:menaquinone biosynthesis decarboxylase [Acidobacteriota bacterium]
MHDDLNSFIDQVEARGWLTRVREPVSPDLEITAVTDLASKAPGGGPALIFEQPTGFDMPVAANLFGSLERICLALNVSSLDSLAREIETLMTPLVPTGIIGALKMLPMVGRLTDLLPKTVKDGPCQEVVQLDGTLDQLPILKCWPEDGGRYITFPLVFTKDPESGTRNIGMYRMQVFDGRTTGMHWQRHKGGAQHHRIAERMGRRLEVAVALGAEPELCYAATAPMPEGLDELLLAGFLARRRIELVKCRTVDLEVPAEANIVLEGYVEPGERRREGPFGDHTGFYSLADAFPVFHLTAITMRRKPIYHTTIVGVPPMEDVYLGKASERIFLPLIRKTIPEIVDMHFPPEGIFHNLVLISIDKRYPGHARKIMNACWGLGQLMFSKVVVVVDKDVNVQDVREVAWVVGTHMDPQRDIQFTRGPMDDLENASDLPAYGSKMGIDATRKWPSEGFTREWPTRVVTSEAAGARALAVWNRIAGQAGTGGGIRDDRS